MHLLIGWLVVITLRAPSRSRLVSRVSPCWVLCQSILYHVSALASAQSLLCHVQSPLYQVSVRLVSCVSPGCVGPGCVMCHVLVLVMWCGSPWLICKPLLCSVSTNPRCVMHASVVAVPCICPWCAIALSGMSPCRVMCHSLPCHVSVVAMSCGSPYHALYHSLRCQVSVLGLSCALPCVSLWYVMCVSTGCAMCQSFPCHVSVIGLSCLSPCRAMCQSLPCQVSVLVVSCVSPCCSLCRKELFKMFT